jgi:hypothetical protein
MKTINMKSLLRLFPIIMLTALIVFTSCKNDFDINADYKDINIVYGILNPSQKRQYIRINRAFLTEGNVFVAATEPDSSNYPYMLNVSISEFNENNQLVNTFALDTVHLPKTSGAFNTGYQPFYYFDVPTVFSVSQYNDMSFDTIYLNPNHTFKLKIENPVTGDITESETKLISDFSIVKPAPFNKFIAFISDNGTAVEMRSPEYAKVYDAKFIFYYREFDVNQPNDTIEKSIIWDLGTLKSERISGGEDIFFQYIPYTFFSLLKNRIDESETLKRLHGSFSSGQRVDIQLVITAGALELSAYIDANKPSNSIIQDRPVYTNVTNGIGIFSSKRTIRLNYYLNAFTIDSLRNGSVAYLNFQ